MQYHNNYYNNNYADDGSDSLHHNTVHTDNSYSPKSNLKKSEHSILCTLFAENNTIVSNFLCYAYAYYGNCNHALRPSILKPHYTSMGSYLSVLYEKP